MSDEHFDQLKIRVELAKLDEKLEEIQVDELPQLVPNAHFELADPKLRFAAFRSNLAVALHNLVANAVRYSKAHCEATGTTPHVVVRIEPAGNHVRFSVIDNGPGMPSDIAERMFKERVSTTGGGLGTMYVKEVVDKHNGRQLGVDTEVGKGTTIRFELPKESPLRKAYGL